ncbi:membrane bound O-acyl transferase family-domain-containing protein [Crucibulum laeve]|uniref:Membrane bound O-acyl transferase family-domain-containing protein n=1 Tax=Crucibulum laeve TaxID=68775 RepID=A0A5C3M559_9AGAR|nr:membrane bound O-acyl transferase family-domain-containing protein [Crucibulum laeve]
MCWLAQLVPPPHTRGPLTYDSFTQDLLPPILLYYATAVLVLFTGTFGIRLAILPMTLWSAFRAATRIDLSAGYNDERLIYVNQGLLLAMSVLAARVIIWTFQLQPYRRLESPNSPSEKAQDTSTLSPGRILIDALDLSWNLRGHGWNWSNGLQIPPEKRPTSSISVFALATASSAIQHILIFDILHYSVQWFSPSSIGSPRGGTIFEESMAPIQRYSRSTLITFLSGLVIYCAIQLAYDLLTLIAMFVFRQQPSQWPPLFDTPWLASSLTEFWAKRWHQLFRDCFISLGGKPLSLLLGRIGGVLGAFLISGILHDFGLWGMGKGTEFQSMGGYFILMGVGIILEHTWRRIAGVRVGGILGWIWTIMWVVGWGNILVDAWSRRGLVGSVFFPDSIRPTNYIFGPLFP